MTTKTKRTPLVIGNWKMNGNRADNARLLDQLLPLLPSTDQARTAVCPPFPYLAQIAALLEGQALQLGGQNVSAFSSGAYTGDVSTEMLSELGCRYVLIGHSERRSLFGETNTHVADKFAAALEAGLTPVLCVGETLEQRQQAQTETVINAQIDAVIDRVGIAGLKGAVIAYEPVWAIGTGETATPQQAQSIHRHIRERLEQHSQPIAQALPLLYGGSVKPDNAEMLFNQPDIDGGLIGGASLDAAAFAAICQSAV